ncbi:Protein phosphatase 1, regulatory subunit, and related proteins [Ectocarpus siliculosus]|uniref:Dynein regulatory complex subunit 3 n=1 Tax=Ectocarpus siliculosus TaxID=2880 RepID=D8LIL7_ECTSI|nr:Protein phosphatase 1, regulatory subunit, and related proteins [Ectocarpus siliculosus]|eukprot:CBN75927.1 Protein phosphatase 1, regulatory subunit, and related proteins [Ectocarpus siliculosus]
MRRTKGIDHLDTAVIDEDLIGGALMEEADGDQHISSMTTFELAQVVAEATTLRLSYKNVLKIDNLQGFSRLTKLCLDNNIIESISNLDHLVHLKWLDLSFNNIKTITGLEKLTELMDLSLYNNQISEIEGLDSCSNLQCLSLGNNRIANLDSIIRLRRYPKLKLVNLEGNPVCREVEYRFTVLAYIKNITYHDYGTVDPAEVLQAKEQYQDELLELQEKEALEEEQLGRERASESETEVLRKANLLVTKTLFSDMFEADAEMSKLKYLPGIDDMTERYRTHVQGVAESYRTAGLANAVKKEEEVTLFDAAVKDLRHSYARRSIEMIEVFTREKKKTFNELSARESIDPGDLLPLQTKLEELESALMDLEMYEVEQHEQLMGEFETNYTEFKNHCFEMQHNFFRAVEEHEEGYFNSLAQLAQDMLEKMAKNELPDDAPDELSNLLIDRDTCMNIVVGSHDIHVGKLLGREDETRAAEIRAMSGIIESRRREERTRNRNRMLELRDFFETNRRHIADLISSKLLEDYDEADGM